MNQPNQPNDSQQPGQNSGHQGRNQNRPGNQNRNRSGGPNKPRSGGPRNNQGNRFSSPAGPKPSGRQQPPGRPPERGNRSSGPKGARPSMSSLMQSVAKGLTPDSKPAGGQMAAGPTSQPPASTLPSAGAPAPDFDNRDSGMLYPGSQFQSKSHEVKDRQSKLRIIPLGGLEEIGMNCMAIEYGQDIVIVDVGWMFPDETMPGVDYVIPDVTYLEKKKQNIRGVLITHGHLDHIGSAPYLLPKLGFPKVYATQFARALMEGPLEEHNLLNRVQWQTVKYSDILQIGPFRVEFFHVNHNIPEGMGLAITTPVGTVVHTGDYKFDETPVGDEPAEFEKIERIGREGVLLAMCDSTNVERPGHTVSEAEIGRNLDELIGKARGRIILSTFSTLIPRMQEALWSAAKNNRKVTIVGRSMLKNVEICQRLGYLEIPKDILVDSRNLKRYRDDELLVICTGSQANEMSALVRMSTGEHRQVVIKQGDTVILSSSPIPGNERSVELMMDNLFRLGADVMYSKMLDIHTSGHAYQEELKQMLTMLKPTHFMPVHGEYRKRVLHGRLANEVGVSPHNVHLLDNGRVLEVNHKGEVGMTKEKVVSGLVFVDGLGVGDVGQVVMRDRKHMAEDGMCVIIAMVDRRSGKLQGNPDIISRGFIYLRESGKLIQEMRDEVRKKFPKDGSKANHGKPHADFATLKAKLRDDIGDFLYQKTQRRPMVLPVILEV